MAYMSQENKALLAPKIKAILKKYGVKGTLSVDNHRALVLTIKEGKLDFLGNCSRVIGKPVSDQLDVNPYWYRDHFDGKCKDFMIEVMEAMNVGNWDKSDIQTDYFNVGWYVHVYVGKWNKPYNLIK